MDWIIDDSTEFEDAIIDGVLDNEQESPMLVIPDYEDDEFQEYQNNDNNLSNFPFEHSLKIK
ncbi:MAG: hypothetical protein JXQ90_07075 [Cyclobacteriaceae bacterium]